MTTTTVITKKNSVEGALITDLAIVESSETMVLERGGDSDAADGAAKSVSSDKLYVVDGSGRKILVRPELPTSLPGSPYVIQGSSTAIEVSSSVGSNSPTSSYHELIDPAHVPDV